MKRLALALVSVIALSASANAQWQTPNHSVPIGRGTGVIGFNYAAPSTTGQIFTSNGASTNPSFQNLNPAAFGTQTANFFFAGPTTGAAANPAFRAIVAADIPSGAAGLTIGTTPIASGTTLRVLYDNAGLLGEYTNTQLTALINPATTALSGALPAWPNNTTTYFRGDGTYATHNCASLTNGATGCSTVVGTSGATIPLLNGANTWSGVQTFTNSDIALLGSSTGKTTFTSANAGATNYTLTVPAITSTITTTIASGAKALATGAISSAACTSAQTDTATGTLTTDTITVSFNADPTAVTGYVPLTTGMLTIIYYPTADTINFKVCNNTNSSITPGAVTINWRVMR